MPHLTPSPSGRELPKFFLQVCVIPPDLDNYTFPPQHTKLTVQTFLDTCIVDIAASTKTVLTWGQIRAALEVLVGTCIASPIAGASGGTAHYSPSPPTPKISKRRKRQPSVSGKTLIPKLRNHNFCLPVFRLCNQRGQEVKANVHLCIRTQRTSSRCRNDGVFTRAFSSLLRLD